MFWKHRRIMEAAAIDAHVRLMAVEVLLPYAMAGRRPTLHEMTTDVELHPDMKPEAVYATARMASRLLIRAEDIATGRHHTASS